MVNLKPNNLDLWWSLINIRYLNVDIRDVDKITGMTQHYRIRFCFHISLSVKSMSSKRIIRTWVKIALHIFWESKLSLYNCHRQLSAMYQRAFCGSSLWYVCDFFLCGTYLPSSGFEKCSSLRGGVQTTCQETTCGGFECIHIYRKNWSCIKLPSQPIYTLESYAML